MPQIHIEQRLLQIYTKPTRTLYGGEMAEYGGEPVPKIHWHKRFRPDQHLAPFPERDVVPYQAKPDRQPPGLQNSAVPTSNLNSVGQLYNTMTKIFRVRLE